MADLRGAALLAGALALMNLGITKGSDWGWASGGVLGTLGATVVLLGLFALSSQRHASPLLEPVLLRLPWFRVASAATILAGFGFYAYLLINTLRLQYVWRYGVLRAGLALVPGAVAAARAQGAWVVSPASPGVGLLEFHQLDRMVGSGRAAARALLEQAVGDLTGPGAQDGDEVSAFASPGAAAR